MAEFFIRAESFAAPFVSDSSTRFVEAATPEAALELFAGAYRHPAGLYAADAYESADAYHKGAGPLARWLCNHEQAKRHATRGKPSYSYLGHAPGSFEIDGEPVMVPDPKGGSVVSLSAVRSTEDGS